MKKKKKKMMMKKKKMMMMMMMIKAMPCNYILVSNEFDRSILSSKVIINYVSLLNLYLPPILMMM